MSESDNLMNSVHCLLFEHDIEYICPALKSVFKGQVLALPQRKFQKSRKEKCTPESLKRTHSEGRRTEPSACIVSLLSTFEEQIFQKKKTKKQTFTRKG
jgi:hypothetical protein